MSSVTVHELKAHPEPFRLMATGAKRHEVRKADRPFKVGDVLRLREYVPETEHYTGAELLRLVSHITTPGSWGLPEGLCVLSLAGEPAGIWTQESLRAVLEAGGLGVQHIGKHLLTSGTIALSDLAQALNLGFTGAEFGLPLAQEPKYTVSRRGRLMVRATGTEIPDDEPVFILRGKDTLAVPTLIRYFTLAMRATENQQHAEAVSSRAVQFEDFAASKPKRMRDPDTCVAGSSIAGITLELSARAAEVTQ